VLLLLPLLLLQLLFGMHFGGHFGRHFGKTFLACMFGIAFLFVAILAQIHFGPFDFAVPAAWAARENASTRAQMGCAAL